MYRGNGAGGWVTGHGGADRLRLAGLHGARGRRRLQRRREAGRPRPPVRRHARHVPGQRGRRLAHRDPGADRQRVGLAARSSRSPRLLGSPATTARAAERAGARRAGPARRGDPVHPAGRPAAREPAGPSASRPPGAARAAGWCSSHAAGSAASTAAGRYVVRLGVTRPAGERGRVYARVVLPARGLEAGATQDRVASLRDVPLILPVREPYDWDARARLARDPRDPGAGGGRATASTGAAA